MKIAELKKLLKAGEWNDVEFKEARSDVPRSAFETVSAFANTHGGRLVFGVAQHGEAYEIAGVEKLDKIQNDFLSVLHADGKTSHDLQVTEQRMGIGGKTVLIFQIAENQRTRKPVYSHPTPTYKNERAGKAFEFFIPELDKEVDMASDLIKAMFGTRLPNLSTDPVKAHDGVHDGKNLSQTALCILKSCLHPVSATDILKTLGYAKRTRNYSDAMRRLLTFAMIEMTAPDTPRTKHQKYRITAKGRQALSVDTGDEK